MATIVAPKASADLKQILDPAADIWSRAEAQTIEMAPTPIDYQPSMYCIVAWKDRLYGGLKDLSVRAVHNGAALAFLMEWEEPQPVVKPDDTDAFADGCAVLFPQDGKDSQIQTMGTPEKPVNAWYWRPNLAPMHITGQGAGSTVRLTDGAVSAKGAWDRGRWRVVVARELVAGEGVQIQAPGSVSASFAIWRGANQERGGIKAFGQIWHEIRLEA